MVRIPTRVLIVDDEADFVEMLSLRLTEVGEKVKSAHSGKECLELLQKDSTTDVVILDIRMPGMDGIEVLKELKTRFPLVEVILLTGHATVDTSVQGMKLGAFDYLLKPADFEELQNKLEGAKIRKYEQEERIRKAEAKILARRTGEI